MIVPVDIFFATDVNMFRLGRYFLAYKTFEDITIILQTYNNDCNNVCIGMTLGTGIFLSFML